MRQTARERFDAAAAKHGWTVTEHLNQITYRKGRKHVHVLFTVPHTAAMPRPYKASTKKRSWSGFRAYGGPLVEWVLAELTATKTKKADPTT
jgi:hypothetical protein